jgi:Family of unknown function (DUF6152)
MQFRSWVVTVFIAVLSTLPLYGHHSFAAEYDSTKPISIKGVVRKLAWVNPHAYIYVDVKDRGGKVVTWAFEILSPNALARQGWNSTSLKFGDEISVEGYLAKDPTPLADGSLHANARVVTRADGRRVFSGNAEDGGPAR